MQPRHHQISESIKNYNTFMQYNILIVERSELLKYECTRVVISQILLSDKCQSTFNCMMFCKYQSYKHNNQIRGQLSGTLGP